MAVTLRNPTRRVGTAVTAALVATAGLVGMSTGAGATSTFTLQRLAGPDRYATADVVDQTAFPGGEPTALLADGVPGHQSDALAAAGVEGAFNIGVLLTDDTGSVPASTAAALQDNHVQKIVVLGGTAAVSQSQISQLQGAGYQVSTPYQGATRYQTMKLVDESMGGAGTDSNNLPTAILASGENNHLVDALAAGGLSFAKHFPIILTNSTGPGLQPEAQQVISDLGIKHLIVAGGSASVPSSEYTPPPSGVTRVDIAAGKDRSQTSQVLADFAIQNGWLKDTNLTVARGDDGADALAGAAVAGVNSWPTVVTNSPTDAGTAPAFATEHVSTLAGTSYVFGGTGAVPDAQLNQIQSAGQANGAPAGPFQASSSQPVSNPTGTTFDENGFTYTYGPHDTYQLMQPSSTPGGSPGCQSDTYTDFQQRLTQGDQVSGTYNPTGTSTFCLNDIAPAAPTASATTNSGGGVTITWKDVVNTAVTEYDVYRAAAQVPIGGGQSCPTYSQAGTSTSPMTPPPSGYTRVASVADTSIGSPGTDTYQFTDPNATAGSNPLSPQTWCYTVASVAPNGAGTTQTGTGSAITSAAGANPPAGAIVPPSFQSLTEDTHNANVFTATYNEAISTGTCDANGSDYSAEYQTVSPSSSGLTVTEPLTISGVSCDNNGSYTNQTGTTVSNVGEAILTFGQNVPQGSQVTVTALKGSDGNTVCAANAASACQPVGQSVQSQPTQTAAPAPAFSGATATDDPTGTALIVLTYNEYIACSTLDDDYTITITPPPGSTVPSGTYSASCYPTANAQNAYQVALRGSTTGQYIPVGSQVTVTAKAGADGNTVCTNGAPSQLSSCQPVGDHVTTTSTSGSAPRITAVKLLSNSGANPVAEVTYSEPVTCSTVDSNGSDYAVQANPTSGSPIATPPTAASCSTSTATTGTTVDITVSNGPYQSGQTITVCSQLGKDGNTVLSPASSSPEPTGDCRTSSAV